MSKQHYPKWVHRPDGASLIVHSPEEHSAHVGYPVDETGQRIEYAQPPTMRQILDAGYGKETAEKIFAEQWAMANAGIKPCGPNEPVQPQPEEESAVPVVEPSDPDPLGLFSDKE